MFYIYLKFDKNGQLCDKRDYFNFAIINFTHLLHIFNIVTCYSEEQMISMLEFLIDSIFVFFGGTLFQQVVDIPMGTNCAPFLADLFLYSYESEFLQKLVKDKKIHEARAFNFTYRYIDDVLSINNSRSAEFLPLIYPPELEVKETTDTASSASLLDLYLESPYTPTRSCVHIGVLKKKNKEQKN